MPNEKKPKTLTKLGQSVSSHPWRMVAGTILITFLMVFGAVISLETGHSEMKMNINDLFPEYEEVEIMKEIEEDFGNVELFIVLIKADDVLTPEVFDGTTKLVEKLLMDSKVMENVIGKDQFEKESSIYSFPTFLANYNFEVISNITNGVDIRNLYRQFLNDDNVTDLEKGLVSSLLPTNFDPASNSKVKSMVLLVALDGSLSDEKLEDIEIHMRDSIIDKARTKEIKMYSYAFGLLNDAYGEAEEAIEPLFIIAIIAILIISIINYRRLSDALLANLTVLIVVIWTFCMIGILGFDYNFMNIMVPLLITGLAIDFSFHAIIGYRERLSGKKAPEKRVRSAAVAMISFVGIAFVLATVTTTFGFLSNVISDLPAIMEFGIAAAFGIVFACALNLTFVPAVRVLLDLKRLKKGKELKGEIPPEKLAGEPGKILKPLSKTVKYPWVIIIVLIMIAIPGYVFASDMQAAYDPTGELLETQEITKAFRTLNKDYSVGTESILVRIDGNLEDPALWQAINESINNAGDDKYISTVDGVVKVEWLGMFLQSIGGLDPSYGLVDADLDGIPDPGASPEKIRDLLDNISANFTLLNQYIHKGPLGYDGVLIRFISRTNIGEHGFDAKDELKNDLQPVYEFDVEVKYTGEPIIWNKGLDDFAESLILSTTLVLIFAIILLTIVFGAIYKSPLLGLLTAIPPILVIGWTLGFMAIANIPLNMMTAFVGSFTVGLGIDYPIHMVTRWVAERKRGRSIIQCYTISIRSTGKELGFSALTTLSAFMAFALMPMKVMKEFGIVMVVAILFSFLGAVFMMPLLIRFWHRKD